MRGEIGCTYAKLSEKAPDDFVSFKDISCANIFTARNLVPLLFIIRTGLYRSRPVDGLFFTGRSVNLGFDLKASFLAFRREYIYYIVRAIPRMLMT